MHFCQPRGAHIDDESLDWEGDERLQRAGPVAVKLLRVLVPLDRVDLLAIGVEVAAQMSRVAADNVRRHNDVIEHQRHAGCNRHMVTSQTHPAHINTCRTSGNTPQITSRITQAVDITHIRHNAM